MKGVSTSTLRNVGHPWTNEPGWDLLFIKARTEGAMEEAVVAAENNSWAVWTRGLDDERYPSTIMYKPIGAHANWVDPKPWRSMEPEGAAD